MLSKLIQSKKVTPRSRLLVEELLLGSTLELTELLVHHLRGHRLAGHLASRVRGEQLLHGNSLLRGERSTGHDHHGLLLVLQGLLQLVDLGGVLADELDHVRHGKVHHLALPSQLQHDVGADQVVASEQGSGEAVRVLGLHKVSQQVLGDFSVVRLGGGLDGFLIELVVL